MNTSTPPLRLALLVAVPLCGIILHSSFVIAQGGPLTPPGAPAPTMRTLQDIYNQDTTTQTSVGGVQTSINDLLDDARTPISSVPFTISTSGSYYLTRNLAVTTGNGITISADQVTLDLNGFTLSSTASPASGAGVLISGLRRNVTVKNGHIRGTTTYSAPTFTLGGFLDGIDSATANTANLRITEVSVSNVGDSGIGCILTIPGSRNVVERCTVSVCGGNGIRAGRVIQCDVDTAGLEGIVADTAVNCFAESVGAAQSNDGIEASAAVDNCVGIAIAGIGVNGNGCTVSNTSGASTSGVGLAASVAHNCIGTCTSGIGLSGTDVTNCRGTSSSGIGLSASDASNCSGTSTTGSFGISVIGTASFCRGTRTGGTAITAGIAIGCTVNGSGTVVSSNKFLGTP